MLSIIKKLFNRKKKSSTLTWAEREIAIAVEREREADRKEAEERGEKYDPKGFSYGGAIYESALKAYKSLLKDRHSGFSWQLTKQILVRLMEGRPLSPLKGTDDEWAECWIRHEDGQRDFQNKRCSSVFKSVMSDGTVKISDVNRVVCIDEETGCGSHFGFIDKEVGDTFEPISKEEYEGRLAAYEAAKKGRQKA